MNAFTKYLQETRAELRHVAWPTQVQTMVYTILVAAFSIVVALYLGLFDFLFTSSLTRVINALPSAYPVQVTEQPAEGSQPTTIPGEALPPIEGGSFNIVPSDTN
jgi:preprotein translocase SecE subunit